ncbi:uncharacterized protein V6R79_013952 [Siganus canaliculatus]
MAANMGQFTDFTESDLRRKKKKSPHWDFNAGRRIGRKRLAPTSCVCVCVCLCMSTSTDRFHGVKTGYLATWDSKSSCWRGAAPAAVNGRSAPLSSAQPGGNHSANRCLIPDVCPTQTHRRPDTDSMQLSPQPFSPLARSLAADQRLLNYTVFFR